MAQTEGSVGVFDVGTAPVRVIKVTTLINGVPTDVDMQVIAIAAADGRPLRLEPDGFQEVIEELREIKELLLMLVS